MSAHHAAIRLLAEFKKNPRDPRAALITGAALEDEGLLDAAVAVWSLGDDVEPQLRRAKDDPNAHEKFRALSARADKGIRRHFTALHEASVVQSEEKAGGALPRLHSAIWSLTHDRPFEFKEPLQKPVIFYMPDLPAAPVTPNELLPWVSSLEAKWTDIRGEYERAVRDSITMDPYVPAATREAKWSKLRGKLDWSSIHLFKNAQRTISAEKFPVTVSALEAVDLVRIDGTPMEAFFSRLIPGAHIPPHYGLTNTRLTVHLPLIVPDDCGIRVGDVTHHWIEGKIVAFDDSYDHEAWNNAPTDRVVLIFETHHPDLSQAEKDGIEHAYAVRQNWLNDRWKLLDGLLSHHAL